MAAKIFYRDAGALRSLTKVFYRDAGVLRTLTKVFYRDAGVLRQVFSSAAANIVNIVGKSVFDINNVTLTFTNSGIMAGHADFVTADEWLTTGNQNTTNAALYEIQCTATRLLPDGHCSGTTGTYLALSINQSWSVTCLINKVTAWDLYIQIRRASDQVQVAAATYNIEVDRT